MLALERKLKTKNYRDKIDLIKDHFKVNKWPLSYAYVAAEFSLPSILLDYLIFRKLKLKVKFKAGSGLVVYRD